jgi:primary-amine oxidase
MQADNREREEPVAVQIPVDTNTPRQSVTAQAGPDVLHPLQPLTRDEISLASGIVREEMAALGDTLRYETIELKEPAKAVVRAFAPGDPIRREARVNVYRTGDIGVWRMLVSITDRKLLAKEFLPEARPMIQLEEFLEIEAAVKRDPAFIEACARRGITDVSLVCVDPWSGGNFGVEGEEGRHVSHAFCWVRSSPHDNHYAHPIEGLNPVVDIKRMEVIRIDDHGITPVPEADHNYDRKFVTETRSHLRPINIEQPDGVSFTMEGQSIRWHDWSLVIGFNAREAITLHDIKFAGRPVCYRASLVEMVVPYGSPSTPHYRKNVFDIGEYGLGKLANSLTLGCDCLGAIHYLDCWISDVNGEPMCIANGICIHEEDDGILWKHWDFRTGRTELRRARRLVISSVSTVGNYEYGSYWYFHLDGSFEFEMKATGVINTSACVPGKADKYGIEVAPGVVGHIHQHLFCARLDMAVDGDVNSVVECNTIAEPVGSANPYGNAYYLQETLLETEGGRTRNPDRERYWKFVNPNRTNRLGQPTAYKLEPRDSRAVFIYPDSPSGRRMPFIRNHLWVTAYDPEERYPGGEFMNHSDGSDGLPAYVGKQRPIRNADIVACHVFGLHHQPRPEDFPVQPCVSTGFKLMPVGFFDTNPTIDLASEKNKRSCHALAAE